MPKSLDNLANGTAGATWPRLSWIASMLLLAIGYRIVTASSDSVHLANTAPLMAMSFGGGLLLGWRFCWIPALLLFSSDLFLGLSAGTGIGGYTFASAVIYTLVAAIGAWVGRRKQKGTRTSWWVLFGGTLSASLLFYVTSNTYAWAVSPLYEKSLAGWWQSQTVGIPGPYPPSLFFLKNALIGDTIWCLLAAPLFFWKPVLSPQTTGPDSSSAPLEAAA